MNGIIVDSDGLGQVNIAPDIDDDGNVTVNDVVRVAYMVVGKIPQDLKADFNNNGRLTIC
jgi:hypothetical protein